jgi:hypothetical protein
MFCFSYLNLYYNKAEAFPLIQIGIPLIITYQALQSPFHHIKYRITFIFHHLLSSQTHMRTPIGLLLLEGLTDNKTRLVQSLLAQGLFPSNLQFAQVELMDCQLASPHPILDRFLHFLIVDFVYLLQRLQHALQRGLQTHQRTNLH